MRRFPRRQSEVSELFLYVIAVGSVVGCSVGGRVQREWTLGRPVSASELTEDSIVLAFTENQGIGVERTNQIRTTIPPKDAPIRSSHLLVRNIVADEMGSRLIDLARLRGSKARSGSLSASDMCESLSESGGKGGLMIVRLQSMEGFNVLFCSGSISLTAELWDIATATKQYHGTVSESQVFPVLWVLNYHELSGRLNKSGRKALARLTTNILADIKFASVRVTSARRS